MAGRGQRGGRRRSAVNGGRRGPLALERGGVSRHRGSRAALPAQRSPAARPRPEPGSSLTRAGRRWRRRPAGGGGGGAPSAAGRSRGLQRSRAEPAPAPAPSPATGRAPSGSPGARTGRSPRGGSAGTLTRRRERPGRDGTRGGAAFTAASGWSRRRGLPAPAAQASSREPGVREPHPLGRPGSGGGGGDASSLAPSWGGRSLPLGCRRRASPC